MIYTTLNKIRIHSPCSGGWAKLLTHLGKTQADDEPLALVEILKSNGLDDVIWCLRTIPEHRKESRLFAIACARKVRHLMVDSRSLHALDVAERYVQGQATESELAGALTQARAAADVAWMTAWSAEDAAWAARAAADAAGAVQAVARAATDAAWAAGAARAAADAADAAGAVQAATDAAWAAGAAGAARAAARAATDAAWAAGAAREVARAVARTAQEKEFIRIFG